MSQPATIRVLIADDHPMTQRGLQHFLCAFPDFELAGIASSGAEAFELSAHHRPDVVLMDLQMGELDGIAAMQQLRTAFPGLCLIALTGTLEGAKVEQALQAGANGFLLKTISAFDLATAIRTVVAGRRVLAPEAADVLVRNLQQPDTAYASLSSREHEVLQLIAKGLGNEQIGARLHVSVWTIKYHTKGLFAKLGVSTRAELIATAYQRGFVTS